MISDLHRSIIGRQKNDLSCSNETAVIPENRRSLIPENGRSRRAARPELRVATLQLCQDERRNPELLPYSWLSLFSFVSVSGIDYTP